MDFNQFAPGAQSNPDANLLVRFALKPHRLGFRSEQEGRDIFEDREYISIIVPGSDSAKVEREATDQDRERFAKQYESFKRRGETAVEGTPLESWPALSPSAIEELKAMKFMTVEMIASASDAQIQKMGMGGPGLRTKAKAFIEFARDTAVAQKYASENEALREDLKSANAEIAKLASRIEAMEGKRKAA